MSAELRAAIDLLAMRDSTVHASLMAGRCQGLSEVATLAHTVLHLATAKAELEAELLKRAMEAPPRVLFGAMLTDTELSGGAPLSPAEQVLAPPARQHGNREPYYLLANCRRLLTHYKWRNADNWVVAMELFGCGSTSGVAICHEAGIDPYSKKVERVK